MDPMEVLITVTKDCVLYNIENGSIIASYKEGNIAPKTLSLIGEDYMIGAISGQPKLRVWTLSSLRPQESATFACRGEVTALAVTVCGTYCVGAIDTELHIWQVQSGELLNILTRHLAKVTCLKFSSDDSHLISGGDDGHVLVWILSQMIGVHIERSQAKPRFVWSDHSREVTDIHTGLLGAYARVATTSVDRTCKVYELDTGILLTTICLDVSLTSVVSHPLDYYIFLGASNGCLYKINTYEKLPREIHLDEGWKAQFKAHNQRVFALSMSIDGDKLLSASDDGVCKLWEIDSMTCVMHLKPHEGKLTNAFLAEKPKALASERAMPQFQVNTFKKDFEQPMKNGKMKLTTSKLLSSPLSLMSLGSNQDAYSDMLCAAIPVKDDKSSGDADSMYYDNICQPPLQGELVQDLKVINNQLYTYCLNRGLDDLSHSKND